MREYFISNCSFHYRGVQSLPDFRLPATVRSKSVNSSKMVDLPVPAWPTTNINLVFPRLFQYHKCVSFNEYR